MTEDVLHYLILSVLHLGSVLASLILASVQLEEKPSTAADVHFQAHLDSQLS